MRKIVAIAAFFVYALTNSNAQEGDIRFGFQLSPAFTWMTANSNRVNSSGTNLGLKMGMIGEYYFRENYALTTALGFAFGHGGTLQHERAGCYWPDSDLGLPVDTTFNCVMLPEGVKLRYNLQYVEIPVGLKMRTREYGYMRYFLEPAITFGFKTQARGSVEGRGIGNDVEKINIRNEVNGFNMAWGLAGGIEYALGESTTLVGGLGVQFGFTDVTKDNGRYLDSNTGTLRDEDSGGRLNSFFIRMAIMF